MFLSPKTGCGLVRRAVLMNRAENKKEQAAGKKVVGVVNVG